MHLISILVTTLIFSASTPCGLLEAGNESLCTTEDTRTEGAGGDEQAGDLGVECCAGCLTCCANFTKPLAPAAVLVVALTGAQVSWQERGPFGSSLSIWRPPRA